VVHNTAQNSSDDLPSHPSVLAVIYLLMMMVGQLEMPVCLEILWIVTSEAVLAVFLFTHAEPNNLATGMQASIYSMLCRSQASYCSSSLSFILSLFLIQLLAATSNNNIFMLF